MEKGYKCVITKAGQKWYYNNGKRISEKEGEKLNIPCDISKFDTAIEKIKQDMESNKCDFIECDDDEVCNPVSGKCVKKSGRVGKKVMEGLINKKTAIRKTKEQIKKIKAVASQTAVVVSPTTHKAMITKKSRVEDKERKIFYGKYREACSNIECEKGFICNPETFKCVKLTGRVGKKIFDMLPPEKQKKFQKIVEKIEQKKKKARETIDANTGLCEDVVCDYGMICNPETGKCVKIAGRLGKALVKGNEKLEKMVFHPPIVTAANFKRKDEEEEEEYEEGEEGEGDGSEEEEYEGDEELADIEKRKKRQKKKGYVTDGNNENNYRIPDELYEKYLEKNRMNNTEYKIKSKKAYEKFYGKKFNIPCLNRSLIKLKHHQNRIAEKFHDKDYSGGMLALYGTGSGKTLAAVAASQCFLDVNPDKDVIFVSPASLLLNFNKALNEYGVKNMNKYYLYSYEKFMDLHRNGRPVDCKGNMLILDEAHNLRTLLKGKPGEKSSAVLKCAYNAKVRLLLSATPFVNSPRDLINIINIIHGKRIVGTYTDYKKEEVSGYIGKKLNQNSKNVINKELRGNVMIYDIRDPALYPERRNHSIRINMTDEFYKIYLKTLDSEGMFGINFGNNPDKFFHGYRRAVNKSGPEYYTEKIKAIIPLIKDEKSVLYTNWLDFGAEPIERILKENNIKYRIISGGVNKKERHRYVTMFNNNKFNVLIITRAGGEGLDLKGVRNIIVVEPPWSYSGLEQIIGRAIRINSHLHLPPEKRYVNVYTLSLIEPESVRKQMTEKSLGYSGDLILYNIIKRKKIMNDEIYNIFKRSSPTL